MTRIVLVRHGQTEWNRDERFRGRADVPLNATGRMQAEVTGRRVAQQWRPSAVYSSPLQRALDTAAAIAAPLGLEVQPVAGLVDINYGDWQGLSPAEARAQWPDLVDAWYRTPHLVHIPGGEDLDTLRRRGLAALQELASRHEGETNAAVGHTVINRVLILGALRLGNDRFWHLHQDTCAINVLEAEAGDFTLVSLNDTCHLLPGACAAATLP